MEWLAAALSAAAIWLTSVRRPICWPVSLAAALLYAWIFQVARLYSDALLQLFFAALTCYGWWNWRRAMAAGAPDAPPARPAVVAARPIALLAALALGVLFALGLGAAMARYTNAAAAWLDAALTAASLVAQFWTARLYRASWVLWIATDVVYVGLYLSRNLPVTAALYAAFVPMAAYGWWRWRAAPSGALAH